MNTNREVQSLENGGTGNVRMEGAAEGGMNTNRDINREVQSLENGSTGNVRMEVEAPAVDNILTIDDSPDTNAEYAPADRQEKDPNTTPTQKTKANSNRSWLPTWSRAKKHSTSQPSQDPVMVAAAGEKAPPENIINKLQGAEEESETQSGARVDNLEKMVKQLSASLEVTNQTALGADMNKHTKDFLKTEIDAQMAKATGRITETKQGMENNKQQIENIAQELTAKTSNFVTNQRVTKLETEINDNLVKKISNLEKEIAKKINTVTKEEMENKFAGIAKEVGRVATLEKAVSKLEEDRANIKPDSYYLDLIEKQTAKKSVAQNNEIASISSKVTAMGKVVTQHTTTLEHDLVVKVNKLEKEVAKKNNDSSANDTKSIIKKITEIEENLQGIDKLGTEFKHLGDMVTQLKNTSICNTYMLHGITFSVQFSKRYNHDYKQFKQKLSHIISDREADILNKHQNHWSEALTLS